MSADVAELEALSCEWMETAMRRDHETLPGSMMPTAEADVVHVWIDTAAGWRVLRRQVTARREMA